MNERILHLRKFLNLTQDEFGSKIGLKRSSLSEIERNKTIVTERNIITICSQFNVNEEWLRFGTGEMFNIININFNQLLDIFNSLNLNLQDFLITTANNLLDLQNKI